MSARYRERPPLPALDPAVACVWTQEITGSAHVQRVVPDGCIDLIWLHGSLHMVGPDTSPRFVPLDPGKVAGVRLRPGNARLLLGDIPASALRDLQVDLDDVWGASSRPLLNRLAETGDANEAATLLERAALARLPHFVGDGAITEVVRALQRPAPPRVSVLAESVGLSERQLRRRLHAAVGYGPHTLESIMRFERARRMARQGLQPGRLAELALTAGYSDQSHLTREVRRFAGTTPGELFAPHVHSRP